MAQMTQAELAAIQRLKDRKAREEAAGAPREGGWSPSGSVPPVTPMGGLGRSTYSEGRDAYPSSAEVPSLPLAGLNRRFLAHALDLGAVSFITVAWLTAIDALASPVHEPLFLGLYFVYSFGFVSTCSATPGKMIVGIRVVRSDGGDPTVYDALIRTLTKDFVSPIFMHGFFRAVFRADREALHDKWSGTQVVRNRF